MRFTIDPEGNQVGDFTYVEKDFVAPFQNTVGSNQFEGDQIEDDIGPGGNSYLDDIQQPNGQAGR